MAYLYAGLGIAMITGISAMLQISNNINKLTPLSVLKPSDYDKSSLPKFDRTIMSFLNNDSVPSEDVCTYLKEKITNPIYEDGEIFISTGTQTPSNSNLFTSSCVLVSKEENHRVLINKKNFKDYGLFSCFLKDTPFCDFEINKWSLLYWVQ